MVCPIIGLKSYGLKTWQVNEDRRLGGASISQLTKYLYSTFSPDYRQMPRSVNFEIVRTIKNKNKKKSRVGKCKLCLSQRVLNRSHLMAAALYAMTLR